MTAKSTAIVGFLASLLPLYNGEQLNGVWCARSMQDGTLILPVDESGWDEELGTVLVRWQGDVQREQQVDGTFVSTLALVRYVEMHHLGQPPKHLASELEQMAQHFQFKTGCSLYLPYEKPSPDLTDAVSKAVGRMGESAVVNILMKAVGLT
ncbi:hypothetical protein [Cognatiluteimonas profundi]|uniref:hypothetical protein n=1 Tax=Cognatiluteimonas profundi TaxID=2594501 RepID=UPI00131AA59B|nr:hypothetical protein [Lysobacter profundi]